MSAIIQNAIDASPKGATIQVTSAWRPGTNGHGRACVRVQDGGPGIPAERLGKLFTMFGTTKKSGTGLGLALAQKIVTAHEGTITVTSREGEGTAVEIALPAGSGSEERASILIVDDEEPRPRPGRFPRPPGTRAIGHHRGAAHAALRAGRPPSSPRHADSHANASTPSPRCSDRRRAARHRDAAYGSVETAGAPEAAPRYVQTDGSRKLELAVTPRRS